MKIAETMNEPGDYTFECPACKCHHFFRTNEYRHGGAMWDFNGDFEKPTVRPSIFVNPQGHSYTPKCHSFISDGKIQYLNDCTHELAGQTVELPNI